MLEFRNMEYGREHWRLTGDCALELGKKYLLLGASGAGKSTIFDLIAGFLRPVDGEICWENEPLEGKPPSARPVSLLMQSHNLFAHLTVYENIAVGINGRLKLDHEDHQRISRIMEELEIDRLAKRMPRTLSGGEQLRAALARTILQNRRIVLLDEPFSSLGPALRDKMRRIVEGYLAGDDRMVILASHLESDILHWPDEILWIENGALMKPVPRAHFLSELPESARRYLGDNFLPTASIGERI